MEIIKAIIEINLLEEFSGKVDVTENKISKLDDRSIVYSI